MSIWKSPILYVGLALMLLVGALTIGPRFIDWTSYRGELEAWGEGLTGRKVTIAGDISARLFPWPRLRVEGLRIANPPGSRMPELLRAEAVEASFLLGPLMSGHFEVSAIAVARPVIGLERMSDGKAGWLLEPGEGAPRLPSSIAFDNITLSDGTLILSDGITGGTREFTNLDADLSAPSLAGPWKLRGNFTQDASRLALSAATGRWQSGEPLKFSLRLRPAQGLGHELSLDGETKGEGFTGKLAAEPLPDPNAGGKLKGFAFRADADGTLERLALSKVEIAPAAPEGAGNALAGTIAADFGSKPSVAADLSASHVDLVKVAEVTGVDLASAADTASLGGLLSLLPENASGSIALRVESLATKGGNLDQLAVKATLARQGLRIDNASAIFPGQTEARFNGKLVAGAAPKLEGSLQLKSDALKDFATWAVPSWSQSIYQGWKGARGTLKLSSPLLWEQGRLVLTDAAIVVDDAKGTLGLSWAVGGKPDASVRLLIDTLDLDRYLTEGVSASAVAGLLTNTGAAALKKSGAVGLTLQADKLLLNGVTAEDVAVDASAAPGLIEVQTIDIGSVEGARLEATGRLQPDAAAPSGGGTLKISAAEPHGLLRLIGLLPPAQSRAADPAWAAGISPLEITIKGDVAAEAGKATITLESAGKAGGSSIASDLSYMGDAANWRTGDAELMARVESPSAAAMASLFGLPAPGASTTEPAALELKASGKLASGLETKLSMQGFGGQSGFNGTISPDDSGPFALRALGVLELNAPQGNAILAAAGIPLPATQVSLNGDGRLDWRPGRFALRGFAGDIGGVRLSGDFARGTQGVEAELKTNSVSLPFLMRVLLLSPAADTPDMTTIFSKAPLEGAKGRLKLTADALTGIPAIEARAGTVEAVADGNALNISVTAETAGAPAEFTLRALPENGGLKMDGTFRGKLPLKTIAAPAADGRAVIDGRFSGFGRSPAGLVLSLSGAGKLALEDLVLAGLNPQNLAGALKDARTAQDVSRALEGPFRQGDFKPGTLSGDFTMSEGELQGSELPFTGDGGLKGTLKPAFSFHEGVLDAELSLSVAEGFSPVAVAWAGAPGALARSDDANAFISALSVKAMKEDMAKLEAIQKEQQRLLEEEQKRAAEEEKRKTEDAAKRKAEETARQKAADELARKLEEEAARRIAEEQAAKPQSTTPVAPQPAPKKPPPVPNFGSEQITQSTTPAPPPKPPVKKKLVPPPAAAEPAEVETAPLPPLKN